MPFLLFHFYLLDSTHLKARELLDEDVTPPFVVQAEVQEAGRGRYGRTWFSPIGGLWFTVVFPPLSPQEFAHITVFASEAVAQALQEMGVQGIRIKVPNDLILHGHKVGGLLGEWDSRAALLGIGLNTRVAHFPEPLEQRAGSLDRLAGVSLHHPTLLSRILQRLETLYQDVLHGTWEPWYRAWHQRLLGIGRRVRFLYPPQNRHVEGVFQGITPHFEVQVDGRLYDLARLKDFREVPED